MIEQTECDLTKVYVFARFFMVMRLNRSSMMLFRILVRPEKSLFLVWDVRYVK